MQDKLLLEMGAVSVCGDLILGGKAVGNFHTGIFAITPEGQALLDRFPMLRAELPKRKPKAKVEVAPEPVVAPEPADDTDDLMDGLLNLPD